MKTPELGTREPGEFKPDAVHVAVMPAVCTTHLVHPGDKVRRRNDDPGPVSVLPIAPEVEYPLGVVDPFLTEPVQPGEVFTLLVHRCWVSPIGHAWELETEEQRQERKFDERLRAAGVDPSEYHAKIDDKEFCHEVCDLDVWGDPD